MRRTAKCCAGLLIGDRGKVSLGRVAFWVVFGLCIYFWMARPVDAFPGSLDEALYAVLTYNLGGKFTGGKNRTGLPSEGVEI